MTVSHTVVRQMVFSGFAKYAADCVRIKRRTGINGSMENVWTADSQAKSVIRVVMYDYR